MVWIKQKQKILRRGSKKTQKNYTKKIWHIECSTFTASSFRIWNSSTRIPSPPLALFVVMHIRHGFSRMWPLLRWNGSSSVVLQRDSSSCFQPWCGVGTEEPSLSTFLFRGDPLEPHQTPSPRSSWEEPDSPLLLAACSQDPWHSLHVGPLVIPDRPPSMLGGILSHQHPAQMPASSSQSCSGPHPDLDLPGQPSWHPWSRPRLCLPGPGAMGRPVGQALVGVHARACSSAWSWAWRRHSCLLRWMLPQTKGWGPCAEPSVSLGRPRSHLCPHSQVRQASNRLQLQSTGQGASGRQRL